MQMHHFSADNETNADESPYETLNLKRDVSLSNMPTSSNCANTSLKRQASGSTKKLGMKSVVPFDTFRTVQGFDNFTLVKPDMFK